MNRRYWTKKLNEAETELGFIDGYRFVYGPWATLDKAKIAFLSLNPGRGKNLDKATMRDISNERGNTYEVEQGKIKSPIVDQFLRLAKLLGRQPADILTGVIAPFRSKDWDTLTEPQQKESLDLGRRFWMGPLSRPDLRLIIASGNLVAREVVGITEAHFDDEACAGWGYIKLRRYRLPGGKVILHLPHLSHFRLLSRELSKQKLRAFLDEVDARSRR